MQEDLQEIDHIRRAMQTLVVTVHLMIVLISHVLLVIIHKDLVETGLIRHAMQLVVQGHHMVIDLIHHEIQDQEADHHMVIDLLIIVVAAALGVMKATIKTVFHNLQIDQLVVLWDQKLINLLF